MGWTVETVSAVDAEIEALPVALSARLIRLLDVVENVGLEALRAPHVKHLEGKLWEMRVRADGGIARGIYATATGRQGGGVARLCEKVAQDATPRPRDCP